MPLASTWSVALFGIDGVPVEIEADISGGVPGVHLIGLPDAALRESKDRVRAAVRNSGEAWPQRQVSIAMSPAALPKGGASYDLALACCVLAAAKLVPHAELAGTVLLGELALDGRLRGVRGVLPALLAARRAGLCRAVVPVAVLREAALVADVEVLGAKNLAEILGWLRGEAALAGKPDVTTELDTQPGLDLVDVVGQPEARWALEVAAAGGHHLLLKGPPGTGKTMLAQRLTGLLPPLTRDESVEVTAVNSVAGTLRPDAPLVTNPPFVAPHHTTSVAALIGGGSGFAKPGAVSKAHRGVLFLDEPRNASPPATNRGQLSTFPLVRDSGGQLILLAPVSGWAARRPLPHVLEAASYGELFALALADESVPCDRREHQHRSCRVLRVTHRSNAIDRSDFCALAVSAAP